MDRSRLRRIGTAGAVAVLLAIGIADGLRDPSALEGRRQDALAYVLLGLALLSLVWRRRSPMATLVFASMSLFGWYALGYEGQAIHFPYLIALYTVAERGDARRTLIVGAVLATMTAVGMSFEPGGPLLDAATAIGWTAAALLFGEAMRSRAALGAAAEARARHAEEDREAEAERRVAEERLRIAREVHDVIAHTVSAMTVQAGVAADAIDSDPSGAREALAAVRSAARDANREIRAVLGLLRSGAPDRSPAPGIASLGEVVEATEAAGVRVSLEPGRARPLPAIVDLTAYRVVQEALTNVIRHARAQHARVVLAYHPDELLIEVTDDGTSAADGRGDGYGLRGMDERVRSLGGSLEHGPAPSGGFAVRARLPIGTPA